MFKPLLLSGHLHVFGYTWISVFSAGYNPIFDESFEFQINLPELALVRFAVLDDDFIGDEFIGQYTIPFDCMQTGTDRTVHDTLQHTIPFSTPCPLTVCKQVHVIPYSIPYPTAHHALQLYANRYTPYPTVHHTL